MSLPDYQTMMRPLLKLFAEGKRSVSEALPALQQQLAVSDEDAQELLPSGKQTIFSNRAHWARSYMGKAGLLETVGHNNHAITEKGRDYLDRFPKRIDNAVLSQSDEFESWRTSYKQEAEEKLRLPSLDATPDDRIVEAFAEIESALSRDVIEAVLSLTPARFEKLVVDLLLAMGYGGGFLERGKQTRLSNDGGIDGIINEDELGLDAVFIQAKRYEPDNKVGRPAMNAFVGSLTGEGANKGVFVTTSDFSKEAIEYLNRVQHRIVTINGDQLARLMIKHEVGVRARKTYVLRSVDEDYFIDF